MHHSTYGGYYYILSSLIVSIMFCLFILFNEYFIVKPTIINTNIIAIIIDFSGNIYPKSSPFAIPLYIQYEPIKPSGIPINRDFNPYKMLSNLIILLNSFVVIPTDFKFANSLLLNIIFVVIVLNIFVTPIKVITAINPYKNIEINKIIFLFSSTYLDILFIYSFEHK